MMDIIIFPSNDETRQSWISKSFRPHVVDVYKQSMYYNAYKGQALLLSHLIGQAGTCMDKMCPS